jgi:hypothetical protein
MDLAKLTELLCYEPSTGRFFWKKDRSGPDKAGTEVRGRVLTDSRCEHYRAIQIGVGGKRYYAHRLAWAFAVGQIPDGMEIDHINGDATDNRLANLRLATKKQNQENVKLRADSSSGYRGVSLDKKSGKWRAYLSHKKKRINLGFFASQESANAAVITARAELYTHYTGRELS